MWIIASILLLLVAVGVAFFCQPSFGRTPRGERLARIQQSPNYRDGKFQNLSPTQQLTSDKSMVSTMFSFLFGKVEGLRPDTDVPVVKTNLKQFAPDEEVLVWLGHSSVYFQTHGKRFLIDPVFIAASPVSFFNKPFKGTNIYSPDDMPDIDFLIISHDHWDHLDYETVKQLKNRVGKVICPLGVGEHFEYWGYRKEQLIELDWNELSVLDSGHTIYCLPARHFSGRGLSPNSTLWASYMLQTPSQNIYLSGDGGYDTHFAKIAGQFGHIDFAILENGQYGDGWKYIHMLPEDLTKAVKDLRADRVLTVHNSKYALAQHAWTQPLNDIAAFAEKDSIHLLTPMIGEPVQLPNDSRQVFQQWWRNQ